MASKHGLGRGLSSLIPQKGVQKPPSDTVGISPSVPPRDRQVERPIKKVTQNIAIEDKKSSTQKPVQKFERAPVADKSTLSSDSPDDGLAVQGIRVSDIAANSQQPRLYFDEGKLKELSESIKEHGIMQPLVVVQKGSGYELIAGERRLRASKLAGLAKVPAIVRGDMDEQKKLEMAIIENVQRHDLNVIEEAKSYKKLADEFNLTQEEVAQKMGKSRSVVANRMRLATLPIEIQRGLVDGKISEGHAKVILSLDNPEKQRGLYNLVISGKLSVRDTERALTGAQVGSSVASHARGSKSAQERLLEDQLSTYFSTKVSVKQKGAGGTITLGYYSDEELKDLLGKLKLS